MTRSLALVLAAQALADFALQPNWLAQRKRQAPYLLLHGLVQAAAAYLAVQAWSCWQLPALVLLAHAATDALKQRRPDTAQALAWDQAAHVAAAFAIVWLLRDWSGVGDFRGRGYAAIVVAGGFVVTVRGAGFLVGAFTRRLLEDNRLTVEGLTGGGSLIGQLERALIFLLVITGHPDGIGFLVAAKSLLRFEEAKQRKFAEYVLIGTLLSFSLAIALSAATLWAIRR